jgi:hypothetical protein
MKETDVESYLRREIKKLNGMPMKFISPGLRGVPDRLILFPGGVAIFVETKAPGDRPGKQQAYRHGQIRKLGFIVRVADTKEKVDKIIEEVKTWSNSNRMTIKNMQ